MYILYYTIQWCENSIGAANSYSQIVIYILKVGIPLPDGSGDQRVR